MPLRRLSRMTSKSTIDYGSSPITIKELECIGLLSVRFDLEAKEFTNVMKSVVGLQTPQCRKFLTNKKYQIFWMSPDEVLVKGLYDDIFSLEIKLNEKLHGYHSSVVNISDSRVFFDLEGKGVQNLLGKYCPVDFSTDSFKIGDFRRTRMAQVPIALSLLADHKFQVMCFTSVKEYVSNLLKLGAAKESELRFY